MALPVIQTERLILRVPEPADLDRWADMMADAETARFIGGVQGRSSCWRSLMSMIGAWHATGISMFSVVEKSSGRWIGRIGPWMPADWPGTEVGWSLHKDAWGRGYALEAAAAAMDYAVDVLGWTRIIHCIDPDNLLSQRLAQRLGSVRLGPGRMPDPFQDLPIDLWGQSANQWRVRRGSD